MPTIAVDKEALFKALGQSYTTEEFDELCFAFGLEVDEDTSEQERPIVNGVQEPAQLKIEVPANRYDLLCFEGISLALNIFREKRLPPTYKLKAATNGKIEKLTIHKETSRIRPYCSSGILRNIKFTPARYASFIALQDKLHQNLARQRSLVAIGTHDLDTIQGPFTYEALPPEEIKFVPLNQKKSMNGRELMTFYENDKHLSKYLHIIRDSPVYPVILDANRTVCSMPPIINSEHSKITLDTENVFIDVTGTDPKNVEIITNIIVCMFSQYTSEPFTVEPVKIESPHNNESRLVPLLEDRPMTASLSDLNSLCGLSLSAEEVCKYLTKMCLKAQPSTTDPDLVDVQIPATRADILHERDIMEDLAIAYGFNKLPRAFPKVSATIGQALPLSKVSDTVRAAAATRWTEVMPLVLCSHDENFAYLNHKDDGTTAIRLANPKTVEYQVVRTTLLPGLLKSLRENKKYELPIRIFEVGDVAYKDLSLERKSRNERHLAAAYIGYTAGFDIVHGLLNHIMSTQESAPMASENGACLLDKKARMSKVQTSAYWLEELDDPTFYPGHAARIKLRIGQAEAQTIGTMGVLHPTVLEKFELNYPVTTLEINIEPFV